MTGSSTESSTASPLSLEKLIQEFNALNSQVKQQSVLEIEKEKLRLLQIVQKKLNQEFNQEIDVSEHEIKPSESLLGKFFSHSFYYFLLLFGLLQDTTSSFLFGYTLLALIPGITGPYLIAASILYTVLDAVLFYAFEVSLLKEALNIPEDKTELRQLLDIYRLQLKTAKNLNRQLTSFNALAMEDSHYQDYVQFLDLINHDLKQKEQQFNNYHESTLKKWLKIGVLAFGAFSTTAGSYFYAQTFVASLGIGVGTTLGMGLILLTVVAALGYFYAMGGKSLAKLVNPDYDQYQTLKQKFTSFTNTSEKTLALTRIKSFYAKKSLREMGTQTDVEGFGDEPIQERGLLFFDPRKTPSRITSPDQLEISDSILCTNGQTC